MAGSDFKVARKTVTWGFLHTRLWGTFQVGKNGALCVRNFPANILKETVDQPVTGREQWASAWQPGVLPTLSHMQQYDT